MKKLIDAAGRDLWVLLLDIIAVNCAYIRMIAEVNGLEHGKSYRLNGVYREGKNIVTFAVNQNNAAL